MMDRIGIQSGNIYPVGAELNPVPTGCHCVLYTG